MEGWIRMWEDELCGLEDEWWEGRLDREGMACGRSIGRSRVLVVRVDGEGGAGGHEV